MQGATTSTATTDTMTLAKRAEASRAVSKVDWRVERNGTRNGAKHSRAKTTNWYHPFLWVHIDRLAPRVDWSSAQMEKVLSRDFPQLFSNINRGTIWRWFEKDSSSGKTVTLKQWSAATLA